MAADLIERLRALSRHEHSDTSIGDEAADALAEHEALMKRIADSPTAKVRGKIGQLAAIYVSHSLVGQRVRILVEPMEVG